MFSRNGSTRYRRTRSYGISRRWRRTRLYRRRRRTRTRRTRRVRSLSAVTTIIREDGRFSIPKRGYYLGNLHVDPSADFVTGTTAANSFKPYASVFDQYRILWVKFTCIPQESDVYVKEGAKPTDVMRAYDPNAYGRSFNDTNDFLVNPATRTYTARPWAPIAFFLRPRWSSVIGDLGTQTKASSSTLGTSRKLKYLWFDINNTPNDIACANAVQFAIRGNEGDQYRWVKTFKIQFRGMRNGTSYAAST